MEKVITEKTLECLTYLISTPGLSSKEIKIKLDKTENIIHIESSPNKENNLNEKYELDFSQTFQVEKYYSVEKATCILANGILTIKVPTANTIIDLPIIKG